MVARFLFPTISSTSTPPTPLPPKLTPMVWLVHCIHTCGGVWLHLTSVRMRMWWGGQDEWTIDTVRLDGSRLGLGPWTCTHTVIRLAHIRTSAHFYTYARKLQLSRREA